MNGASSAASRVWQRVVHSHLVQSFAHPAPSAGDIISGARILGAMPAGSERTRVANGLDELTRKQQSEHNAHCDSCGRHRGVIA